MSVLAKMFWNQYLYSGLGRRDQRLTLTCGPVIEMKAPQTWTSFWPYNLFVDVTVALQMPTPKWLVNLVVSLSSFQECSVPSSFAWWGSGLGPTVLSKALVSSLSLSFSESLSLLFRPPFLGPTTPPPPPPPGDPPSAVGATLLLSLPFYLACLLQVFWSLQSWWGGGGELTLALG